MIRLCCIKHTLGAELLDWAAAVQTLKRALLTGVYWLFSGTQQ